MVLQKLKITRCITRSGPQHWFTTLQLSGKMLQKIPLPKDMAAPMSAAYHPQDVEKGWVQWWTDSGFFTPNAADGQKVSSNDKFVMVIPPPNVTGALHLGHTLTNAVQDALTRYNRMCGKVTLWVPGTDHAGIATQSVVERQLLRDENLTRHDLGREEFLRRVWQWKEKYGGRITYQLRRLGTSYDWSREVFTMDSKLSRAVTEAFVRLFDMGLIYRETRLVSWCPYLKTALSDIEVDTDEIPRPDRIRIPGYEKTVEVGYLWYFKYAVVPETSGESAPLSSLKSTDNSAVSVSADGEATPKFIEVATTRLETMLGDVAVAVHPEDPRYRKLIGKRLVHPFFPERDMRVVADTYVEREFGTGAVKITPAHDKNDYELGKRHNLPSICVFTIDGRIAETGGQFAGLHRFECRTVLEKTLTEMGVLTDKKPNDKPMQLPRCSRTGDIVEYMLVPQWWMNCTAAAASACEAVRDGSLTIKPSSYNQTWFYWLENIRDWCISRQLWWGHRIPAYRIIDRSVGDNSVDMEGKEIWVAARNEAEASEKAVAKIGHKNFDLRRDEDVLDTWFSSGLFPFSVFGWPEETEDFKAFFPTTVLETGHDIIFFWVARMVMLSLLLTKQLPFKRVLLHAMVRDAHGKKMSKSLGNVIDPIEAMEGNSLENMLAALKAGNLPEKELKRASEAMQKDFPKGIPECGADALRLGLLAYTSQGRSINLDVNRVVGYRHFCNKLWNAVKFALIYFPEGFQAHGITRISLSWADRWILHSLDATARKANKALTEFDFGEAVRAVYNFWLYHFCDVYLELLKGRFANSVNEADKAAALEVLHYCIEQGLALLHPFIPFVTEELYQRLPASESKKMSISIAVYPQGNDALKCENIEAEFHLIHSAVHHFRSLLVQLEVPPKERLNAFIRCPEALQRFYIDKAEEIAMLAKTGKLTVVLDFPKSVVADVVSDKVEIAVDASETINLPQGIAKIEKKLKQNETQITAYTKKTLVCNYETKVPEAVRAANSEKLLSLQEERTALERALKSIRTALQEL